jgi:hypothetical protein
MNTRAEILSYLEEHGRIFVNSRWRVQTKNHPVLRKLIRTGKVKMFRDRSFGAKASSKRQSYVALPGWRPEW